MKNGHLLLFLFLLPWFLSAAPVPYSGKVAINGANFQGDARFTFALRDAHGTVHWRNGADANASVTLDVDRGLYVTLLGGNTMNDFPKNLFLQNSQLFLVVHFYRHDTKKWLRMLPDQLITSAPHALAAEVARNALTADAVKPGSITKSMLAAEVLADLNASVVLPEQNATLQSGSVTLSHLSPGVRAGLNATITRSRLSPDVLADLNRSMLPADVLADLNGTISRSRLSADTRHMPAWLALLIVGTLASELVSEQDRNDGGPGKVFASHSPMRPLPVASSQATGTGRFRYVDGSDGDDADTGGEKSPWKSLAFSLRQLEPGDTLFLREGTYYEKTHLSRSGTEDLPITIRSYPGELAILDGGRREFFEDPEQAWMPNPEGSAGEFVSTRTYHDADARRVPTQFLPAAWEPMWGIEEERPLALGHFADSMVPLHSYRIAADLRATNEFWIGNKHEMRETGIYCGPGLWFNRQSGRIHIRLAPHQMPGLGQQAYRGETDPRKLRLSVSVGFGEEVLRINGVRHVRFQDLVFRGATGSPMIHVYGSQHIELDHLTVYGGFPALLVNASQKLRVTNSAFRGLAAPWTSRAHMKYRGTASYQIVFRNDQPRNEDIELAWCEFTDDHDFAFLRYVRNLQFHHNFVDNFNDDGLECGPKLRDHTLFIYQNRIGRCLIPLTQHEIEKDEAPLDHDPESGVYVYRNVFDMRGGTYKGPPAEPDPTGEFLRGEGHLVGDHGGPIWPVMRVYHNTFLRETPVWRNYFLFGLGAQGMRQNERDVFNNIFVQSDLVPGVTIPGKSATTLREGGNLLWGMREGPQYKDDLFGKFRSTPLFELSQAVYSPGWTTQDRVADPGFVSLDDLRLPPESRAVDSGQSLPTEWPDPLKQADMNQPDSGVLPAGARPWGIGVDSRLSLFGGAKSQD